MVYEDLILQYQNLYEEYKNLLLLYKSRLELAINDLKNPSGGYIQLIYEEYKKLLDNPKNMFLKFTVFKDVSFTNLKSFIHSLNKLSLRIEEITSKLRLVDNMTVYRAISVEDGKNINGISKSTLISTSTDISVCSSFLIQDDNINYKHYLYQINLEKGSLAAVCPYSILLDRKDNHLILTSKNNQKEVILSRNNYEFVEGLSTTTKLDNGKELNIIIVDAKSKTNADTNKISK